MKILPRATVFACGSLLLAAGCQTSENGTSEVRKTQDSALKDPFGYGPDNKSLTKQPGPYDDVDPTDISGGGTGELNKRAMKRDLDAVFGK